MDIGPTFKGYIEDENDALLVLQATLDGRLRHIPRRPYEVERRCLIISGSIFVFIEELSGIKRWTDGVSWSPSRISGKFLMYKELDKSAQYPSIGSSRKRPIVIPPIGTSSMPSSSSPSTSTSSSSTSSPPLSPRLKLSASGMEETSIGGERRALVPALSGSGTTLPSPYQNFSSLYHERSCHHHASKYTGFVKKTMSVKIKERGTMSLETLHIVSYYAIDDVQSGKLIRPRDSTFFDDTKPSKELLIAMENTSLGSHGKSASATTLVASNSPIIIDSYNNTAGSMVNSSQQKIDDENDNNDGERQRCPSVPNMKPLPCLRIPSLVTIYHNDDSRTNDSSNSCRGGGMPLYSKFARFSGNTWPSPYFNNNNRRNFQSPSGVTRNALTISTRSQPPPPMLSKLNARFYNFPLGRTNYGNNGPKIDQSGYFFYSVPPAPIPSTSIQLPHPLTGITATAGPSTPPVAMTSIPNIQDGNLSNPNTTNTTSRKSPTAGPTQK